jgi:seryl-tRNA synthetase
MGKTPEENLNVFEAGAIPVLHEGAQPHWELVKKYDIIDFELEIKSLEQDSCLREKEHDYNEL